MSALVLASPQNDYFSRRNGCSGSQMSDEDGPAEEMEAVTRSPCPESSEEGKDYDEGDDENSPDSELISQDAKKEGQEGQVQAIIFPEEHGTAAEQSTFESSSFENDIAGSPASVDSPAGEESGSSTDEVASPSTPTSSPATLVGPALFSPTCTPTTPMSSATTPGGLVNLGNTCYMASALQLLGSVAGPSSTLGSILRRQGSDDHAACDNTGSSAPLRQALLDLWDGLAQNSTSLSPQYVKQLVDERTALFEGHEQQDAHEFLTTLLDLVDQECKEQKTTLEEKQEAMLGDGDNPNTTVCDHNSEPHLTKDLGRMSPSSMTARRQDSVGDSSSEDGCATDMDMDTDTPNTPCKRMKTCAPPGQSENKNQKTVSPEAAAIASNRNSFPTSRSFSELNIRQIEQLLHGSFAASTSREGVVLPHARASTAQSSSPAYERHCRLVGGRMNPNECGSHCSGSPLWSRISPPMTVLDSSAASMGQTINNTVPNRPEEEASAALVALSAASILENDAAQESSTDSSPDDAESSPIDECFTTKVRIRLTCDSCKYTRTREETYLHWSLEMPSENLDDTGTTIDDVVRRFFADERREVKCEKCFGDSATQTSQIVQLPKLLLLHLKRFVVKVSNDYFANVSYEKNTTPVSFAATIWPDKDLDEYLAVDCEDLPDVQPSCYRLRSVIHHHGSSVNFGHYTADVHMPKCGNTSESRPVARNWYRCNDEWVSEISQDQAVHESGRSAYMILYELE